MLSTRGGMDIEAGRGRDARGDRDAPRRPAARLPALPRPPPRLRGRRRRRPRAPDRRVPRAPLRGLRRRGGDARRGQPADRHARAHARRARRQGDARRQLALPPPRQRGAARPLERGPAGADGEGARPDLRQARRQHRHPRQRRRPRDVDARRRRPARRRAGQLPRRRRRREGRRDHRRGRGDPLGPEGRGGAVQHLRRHHALRRGRARADRGLRADQADGPVRRAPRRHQRRGGARAAAPRRRCRTCTPRATMDEAAARVVELAHRR